MIQLSLNDIRRSLMAVALISSTAAAAVVPPQVPVPAPVPSPQKHMLFKIHGKDGQTVYLLGSVHLLDAAGSHLPAEIDSAFSRASTVAFEVNTDSAKAHAMDVMLRGRNAPGVTLSSSLSAAGAARADSLLHSYGMSIDMVGGYKPWLVSVMLAQLAMQKNGFQPQYGVEMQIDAKAHAEKKTIIGLEPFESQLAMFEGLSAADQEKMLVSAQRPDSALISLNHVRDAWSTGNTAALDSLLNKGTDSPTLFAALVTDRNKKWIPAIEELLNGSCDALVVVGSGHLVGKEGLVALLRAKGYSVEQM